ncbi:hypothetical protein BH20VER1_BH20VER1_17580 [soil metagenome]
MRLTSPAKPLYLTFLATTSPETTLELKDIKAIIDLMKKNDLSSFEMEKDGFKLKLEKGASEQPGAFMPQAIPLPMSPPPMPGGAAPAAPAAGSAAPAAAEAPAAPKEKLRDIVSPMVGTFYRASSPESPVFAELGKTVTAESVVCIIEAMKVMNEIKAEIDGEIAEIVAENGKPVQFGQVLFRVR